MRAGNKRGTLLYMDNRTSERDFTVVVEGHLVAVGVWGIDGTLRFREGLKPQPADALYGEGRHALFEAILREDARGRAYGAHAVRVRMDIAGTVREFDLGNVPGGGDLPR